MVSKNITLEQLLNVYYYAFSIYFLQNLLKRYIKKELFTVPIEKKNVLLLAKTFIYSTSQTAPRRQKFIQEF